MPFVPDDFDAPAILEVGGLRLEPLGPQHNARDHAAWSGSVAHIRATPGWAGSDWPQPMTLEQNLADLERHAEDFVARRGFTYSVLDGEEVVGCVYIYPSREGDGGAGAIAAAEVRSWVTADRADVDPMLWRAVSTWLAAEWPFDRVDYAPRTA